MTAPAAPAPAAPPAAPAPAAPVAPAAPAAAAPPAAAPPAAPAAPAAPAPGAAAPPKYDLKLPEKSTLDPAVLEKTTAIASASGLSPDVAQKVVDLADQVAAAHATKTFDDWQKSQLKGGAEWEKRNTQYLADALKDPDLGNGDPAKLAAAAELGKRALATWFPKEMVDLITTAGLESHPGLLKGLVKIGKAMKEDDLVLTPGKPAPGAGKRTADVLYDKTPPAAT